MQGHLTKYLSDLKQPSSTPHQLEHIYNCIKGSTKYMFYTPTQNFQEFESESNFM